MRNLKFILVFLFLMPNFNTLNALEIKHCYIKDSAKHESNQKLLKQILDEQLSVWSHMSSSAQAYHLSFRISQIAEKMLKYGFAVDAYEVPEIDQNSAVSFNHFTLWEGENNPGAIPLTFFVYVWPSEEFALKYNPCTTQNCFYASNIHTHPISCAFAVLEGTIIQNNYQPIGAPGEHLVRLVCRDMFQRCEGEVDDAKNPPFIHQLFSKNTPRMSLSLHAYGLSSGKKVMDCFKKTRSECSYYVK
jgi:hypothetical protein